MNKENIERNIDKTFPFTYNGWDDGGGDYGDIVHYDVEFTDDFGPIKRGDKFDSVFICLSKGILSAYNKDVNNEHNTKTFTASKEIHVLNFKAICVS